MILMDDKLICNSNIACQFNYIILIGSDCYLDLLPHGNIRPDEDFCILNFLKQ